MRYFASIAALFCFFMPASALANCTGTYCNDILLTRIYVNGPITYLQTNADQSLLDCDTDPGNYLRVRRSDSEYDDWYALLLTAFAQGAPISLRTEPGTGTCYIQYVMQNR
ncbi:hypothetical protein HFP57_05200 [Parasphingopyxis algicola]|uniref:hypothetical protein n=1 Tax=Parasphingopyxis algicola TaxID=2026624 RepID=UPI0015A0565E|nr:hypothetical protein [Parasphingopyxis algicola]QLC24476.1 hypothetical protein HFP57_05200 [Parasphingopyxis algicola]